MSDPEHSQQQPTYTPASFEKRTAAWMGIAYALMLLFVTTFYIFTGKELPGTFPLLLLPVSGAGIVLAIYRQRKGTAPGGIILTVLIILIALAAIVLGLALGGPALIHAIRTAYA
ncbi:MAG TPA: hypothetical protein IAC21_00475 [Candidatus Enterenecus merdae]|nr:hypothetical protein [Candidatus Enterenecus merdae]